MDKRYMPIYSGMLLVSALILIGLVALYTFYSESNKICYSNECFISSANQCSNVEMQKVIAGSTYRFVGQNCILNKSILRVSPEESETIKSLLQNKSMLCPYKKGEFNPDLINTLSQGLEPCEGNLKDALDGISEIA